jgi:hypothetical protein
MEKNARHTIKKLRTVGFVFDINHLRPEKLALPESLPAPKPARNAYFGVELGDAIQPAPR